jgi:hypothetical protein
VKINPTFPISETVWHRCDSDCQGIVTGLIVRPNNALQYMVCWGGEETTHYEFELTDEKPVDGVTPIKKEE